MRRLALSTFLVLLVVACSGGEGDAADRTAVSSQAGDETIATAGVTATSDPDTAGSSTSVADTTTTSVSPAPRFAVVVAIDGALGWYDGNSWVQAQSSLPIQGGETFQVFQIGDQGSETVAVETDSGCELAQPSIGVTFDPDPWAGGLDIFGPNSMAVSAPWDAEPHGVFPIQASPEYQQIASSLLADAGVDDPEPRFAQLLRTDMDGDGVDEVFAVAERRSDPSGALLGAPPGDYSLAFARIVVGEEVRTFVLAQWVVPEPDDDAATSELVIYRFDAFMDADDDNTDEFGLRTTYYEGSGVSLYDYRGPDDGFVEVIRASCGA